MNSDPWAVLGVEPTASMKQIRTAYRTRSMLLHPDLHRDRPEAIRREAERAMAQLTAAYETVTGTRQKAGATLKRRAPKASLAYRLGWLAGRSQRRTRG